MTASPTEPPTSKEPTGPEALAALIAEATGKSSLMWLDYPELGRPRLVWHVWHEGAAYVVSGGAEQPLPGIEGVDVVRVTVRSKDTGARLLTWVAKASTVRHGTPEWQAAASVLMAERLNAPKNDQALLLWGADSTITRLKPTGEVPERPGEQPDGDLSQRPVETPATTRGPLPKVVHRRPRKSPKL